MIPAPYRILAVVLVWLASLVAVGIWQRHDGSAAVEAKWQKREAAEQAQAAAQITALQQEARQAERDSMVALNDIARWLIDFAADADDVARQLASCQQIVIEDRNSR